MTRCPPRWLLISLLLVLCGAVLHVQAASEASAWGKVLVARYDIPTAPIAAAAARTGGSTQWLDAQEVWRSPNLDFKANANPYTLVVRLNGHAPAAGPASSLWYVSLALPQDDGAEKSFFRPVAGLNDADEARGPLAARRIFERVAAAAPMSVKQDMRAALTVSVSKLDNVEPIGLSLEVWAGVPQAGWKDWLFSTTGVLVGVVMLGLWGYWRHQHRHDQI